MGGATDFTTELRQRLGDEAVDTGEAARGRAVDGQEPKCLAFPATTEQLGACLTKTSAAGLAVIPTGNGTRLAMGRPPQRYDAAVSTRRMRRVLAHEAADMTVTVEAGATLAEVNGVLAGAGQRLPLDPPQPESTTIGAVIAMDANGPLRWSQGKARDLLIGITAVLADGTIVKGGGRVVKNVAGYDLMKLFTGSFGTLGVIAEATFKVRPLPEGEVLCGVPAEDAADAARLALGVLGALAPSYVVALNEAAARRLGFEGARVIVGCAGGAEEIAAQEAQLAALAGRRGVTPHAGSDGAQAYAALRDLPAHAAAAPEESYGCKIILLPSRLGDVLARVDKEIAGYGLQAECMAHVGSGVATLRCHAADGEAFARFAEWLRPLVRAARGWAVFDALPTALKTRVDPWGFDVPGLGLMRGIKTMLDPQGCLSPGRFVGGI